MEISKNTKTVTLTKEELTDAIRVYLLAKDVEGTVTNVNTKEADRSQPFDRAPNYEFVGVTVTVES